MARRRKDTLVEVEDLKTGCRAEWDGKVWNSRDKGLAEWLNKGVILAKAKLDQIAYVPNMVVDLGLQTAQLANKRVKVTYQPPEDTSPGRPEGVY